MGNIFTVALVQPILNILAWLYSVVPGSDLGISIILLTIIVKAVLYPFTVAQIKQQRSMQTLQPKMDEIRTRLKDNKEAQAKELMDLYKTEKVNPASSCLPLLIQLPVFIALYQALRDGLNSKNLELLYSFVPNPGTVNPMMFGIVDLSKPNIALAVLAGAVQFWQSWQMLHQTPVVKKEGEEKKKEDDSMASAMNKQMLYVMPLVTIFIGIRLPGGLTLYWLVMSLLTVLQQWYLLKKPKTVTAEVVKTV